MQGILKLIAAPMASQKAKVFNRRTRGEWRAERGLNRSLVSCFAFPGRTSGREDQICALGL